MILRYKNRRFLTTALLFSISYLCCANDAITSEKPNEQDTICSFWPFFSWKMRNLREADPEAHQVVEWIAETVGMTPNFELYQAEFDRSPIAFADKRGGVRRIVYDTNLRFIADDGRINFMDVAVMAHEMGHHFGTHIGKINLSNHAEELEADRLAGFIIGKLGGTRSQATQWTNRLSLKGSLTHPPRERRKQAASEGWHLAQKTIARETQLHCKQIWLGAPFSINYRECRLAQRCDDNPVVSLACLTDEGNWRWQ